MLVITASPARTAFKNRQLSGGESHAIHGTGHPPGNFQNPERSV
jgi:hypothetical protein